MDFEFSWPGQGTNPQTFTGRKAWIHAKNKCLLSGQITPFATEMFGCNLCGCPSHSMVRVQKVDKDCFWAL